MTRVSNKKIKILYILPTLNITGGIESYVVNYYLNFDKAITADFITHEIKDDYYKNIIEKQGGKVYLMPRIGIRSLGNFTKKLKEFFAKNHDYDIIHCNMANAGLFYFYEANKYNIPVKIIHSHQNAYADTISHSIRNIPLIKLSVKMANVNFACSKLAGDFLFKNKKYHIINNAINFKKFEFNDEFRKNIRNKYNISDDTFLIGNVGRLVPQKNQLFLIEIMKEIVKKDLNTKLMIIGDGELKEKLEQKIDECNLKNNVLLIEGKSNINEYYCAFDCFVLPSIYEGLGFVNIEAQVCGLNVITSTGVPQEAKITEHLEYLNLESDASMWATEIMKKKRKNRNKLKEEIYNSGYDIEKEAQKLQKLYSRLVKGDFN